MTFWDLPHSFLITSSLLICIVAVPGMFSGTAQHIRQELILSLSRVLPGSATEPVQQTLLQASKTHTDSKLSLGLLFSLVVGVGWDVGTDEDAGWSVPCEGNTIIRTKKRDSSGADGSYCHIVSGGGSNRSGGRTESEILPA